MGLEELKNIIDRAMLVEVKEYGDEAVQEFYRCLKDREFKTTRCKNCGEVALPPRMFCPACFGMDVEWIDLPRKGTLFAFTQQERSLMFGKPDVIGVVEFPEIGRLLTRIDAPFESLSIGMEVELDFIDVSEDQTLHQFRPIVTHRKSFRPVGGAKDAKAKI
jgi:uncharacterized OB-fold protein